MEKKFTVKKPSDVLFLNEECFNDDTRPIAEVVDWNADILRDALYRIKELEDYIKNQQQKIGYWTIHNLDPKNDITYLECSRCKSWYLRSNLTRNTYCPNCGSRNEKVR